jgi:excisionase family DNA binding protein
MGENTLLTAKEVAKYLEQTESTVYAWAQEGKIPAIKIGRILRFRRADIETWSATGEVQSADDDTVQSNTLLTVKEVAEYLRMKESTVYVWAQEGKIPAIKISRTWRFRQADLAAWLARHAQPMEDDIER